MSKPRFRLLLDHFSQIKDTRRSWKIAYPLREVLFLVVCATIANCDDYEEIIDWGCYANLAFLQGFSEFYHGIPCADWLRSVMNRLNPDLFRACFSWVAASWPDKLALVAIDGRTSRRSHNRKTEQKALHLVSALATER